MGNTYENHNQTLTPLMNSIFDTMPKNLRDQSSVVMRALLKFNGPPGRSDGRDIFTKEKLAAPRGGPNLTSWANVTILGAWIYDSPDYKEDIRQNIHSLIESIEPLFSDMEEYKQYTRFMLLIREHLPVKLDKRLFIGSIVKPSFIGKYVGHLTGLEAYNILKQRYDKHKSDVIEAVVHKLKIGSDDTESEITTLYDECWLALVVPRVPFELLNY